MMHFDGFPFFCIFVKNWISVAGIEWRLILISLGEHMFLII